MGLSSSLYDPVDRCDVDLKRLYAVLHGLPRVKQTSD